MIILCREKYIAFPSCYYEERPFQKYVYKNDKFDQVAATNTKQLCIGQTTRSTDRHLSKFRNRFCYN